MNCSKIISVVGVWCGFVVEVVVLVVVVVLVLVLLVVWYVKSVDTYWNGCLAQYWEYGLSSRMTLTATDDWLSIE